MNEPRRILAALRYSLHGLRDGWKTEPAFRTELILGIPLVALALYLPLEPLEKLALIGSVALVWIAELLNIGIEAVTNIASPQIDPLAKRAKDAGSAAVFVALLFCGLCWGVILAGA